MSLPLQPKPPDSTLPLGPTTKVGFSPLPPSTGPVLTPEQINFIVARGQWYFDMAVSPRNSPMAFGDTVTFTGQGLKDLNSAIGYVSANSNFATPVRITCEVGSPSRATLGNTFPKYVMVHIEDLYNLKTAFIAAYGSVDRPSAYRGLSGGSMQVPLAGTVLVKVDLTGTAAGSNTPPYFMPNA